MHRPRPASALPPAPQTGHAAAQAPASFSGPYLGCSLKQEASSAAGQHTACRPLRNTRPVEDTPLPRPPRLLARLPPLLGGSSSAWPSPLSIRRPEIEMCRTARRGSSLWRALAPHGGQCRLERPRRQFRGSPDEGRWTPSCPRRLDLTFHPLIPPPMKGRCCGEPLADPHSSRAVVDWAVRQDVEEVSEMERRLEPQAAAARVRMSSKVAAAPVVEAETGPGAARLQLKLISLAAGGPTWGRHHWPPQHSELQPAAQLPPSSSWAAARGTGESSPLRWGAVPMLGAGVHVGVPGPTGSKWSWTPWMWTWKKSCKGTGRKRVMSPPYSAFFLLLQQPSLPISPPNCKM